MPVLLSNQSRQTTEGMQDLSVINWHPVVV